jgi:hypothetical protein
MEYNDDYEDSDGGYDYETGKVIRNHDRYYPAVHRDKLQQ